MTRKPPLTVILLAIGALGVLAYAGWLPAPPTIDTLTLLASDAWNALQALAAAWRHITLAGLALLLGLAAVLFWRAHRRALARAAQRSWDAATRTERARVLREVRMLEHAHLKSAVTEVQTLLEPLARATDATQRALALYEVQASLARLSRVTRDLHGQVATQDDDLSALPHDYQQTLIEVTRNFSRMGLACALHVVGAPRPIPAAIGAAIQLVLYNALTNAQQHGRASTVRVELAYDLACVALRVVDNGRGFDPATPRAQGRGLLDIAAVAAQHGGRSDVRSTPGQGSTVHVEFPLERPALGWGAATMPPATPLLVPDVWSPDALRETLDAGRTERR